MITTFENRCVLKNYLIVLRPIFDTTYKGKKQVKIYMWALHHELVLFQKSRNCFRYVLENDIEGGILGWTTSMCNLYTTLVIHYIRISVLNNSLVMLCTSMYYRVTYLPLYLFTTYVFISWITSVLCCLPSCTNL